MTTAYNFWDFTGQNLQTQRPIPDSWIFISLYLLSIYLLLLSIDGLERWPLKARLTTKPIRILVPCYRVSLNTVRVCVYVCVYIFRYMYVYLKLREKQVPMSSFNGLQYYLCFYILPHLQYPDLSWSLLLFLSFHFSSYTHPFITYLKVSVMICYIK